MDHGVGSVHALRGRGFSYSNYFMLKVIQWPLGSALTVGLVHDNLDRIISSLEPFSMRSRLNKMDYFSCNLGWLGVGYTR